MLERFARWVEPTLAVLMDRLRAAGWRLRGAHIGLKSRLGKRCEIQQPWGLVTGKRCQFEHGVFVKLAANTARIEFGDEVFVGHGVEFDISGHLKVGNHVLFAPGCFITDHFHRHAAGATIASQGCEEFPVSIGDDVWVGAKAVILAGVTIGKGAIIGAGAVVRNDVAPMTIVAGVPARTIGSRS